MKRNRGNNGVKIEIAGANSCADNKRKNDGEKKQPNKDMDVYKAVEEARELVDDISIVNNIHDLAMEQARDLIAKHKQAMNTAAQCRKDIERFKRRLAEIGKLIQEQSV